MANQWTTHVKDYAHRHEITYGRALSKPECKAEYTEKYPKPLMKKEQKAKAEEETKLKVGAEKQTEREPKVKHATAEEKYKAKLESNKMKRRERAEIAKKEKYGL